MFETVEHQFPGAKYGGKFSDLDEEKWNVSVVSIEGFFDSVLSLEKKTNDSNDQILVNIINDCELDIDRAGRDPGAEERINLGVLRPFINFESVEKFILLGKDSKVLYKELKLSELKTFRNEKEKCLEYFKNLFIELKNK